MVCTFEMLKSVVGRNMAEGPSKEMHLDAECVELSDPLSKHGGGKIWNSVSAWSSSYGKGAGIGTR